MNLKKIFEPESIAVVGISLSNPFNPANVIFNKNHLRYHARSYCINPKGGRIDGEKVYRSMSKIPDPVDLAVLSIRAEFIPETLKECIRAGVSGAIIISGGFSEVGKVDLEETVRDIALKHEFPVIGPNCIGVFSPPYVDSFFLPYERLVDPIEGSVGLVSQSGGILVDQIIKLTQENVGISRAVSIGNKAVIDEVDVLKFFKRDKKTKVIGIYIEGFSRNRGREFIEEVENTSKPVVVLKSGKTPGGTRAVSSHTASIAGDYYVFSEIVKSSRAIEAKNEKEFVSFCESLSSYKDRNVRDVCIITASGGHGALASDECFNAGLNIPEVPEADRQALKGLLSDSIKNIASLANPLDMTGSATNNDFVATTGFMLEKDYVDCIILLLLPYLPGITTDIGARISHLLRQCNKPVITYIPRVEKYGIFIEGFEVNGVPVAHSVDAAVHMVRGLSGVKK